MAIYITTENQSLFDLSLIIYGTLDKVIKLSSDNNITLTDAIPNNTSIIYDDTFSPIPIRYSTGLSD